MELGIFTFGAMTPDPSNGIRMGAGERLRNLLEEMELADQVGLDVFAVGEHHRPDYAVSSPAVVLAAASGRTSTIRLASAVTVLSSDEPLRVYQQFATLDLLSAGRAEIMVGRGSFSESFALFGRPGENYETLFDEKLDLLLRARAAEHVTWSGRSHPGLRNVGVYPRIEEGSLPIWLGVGGTTQSVLRAARLGLPMSLAIIGGNPAQFAPLVALYRDVAAKAGHDAARLPVAISSNGFVADTSQRAADVFYPSYELQMNQLGRERGWGAMTRPVYDGQRRLDGALAIGSPAELVDRILHQHSLFRHDRFLLQMSVGTVPHAEVMRSIELYGTHVAPAVRRALAPAAGGKASADSNTQKAGI